MADKTKSTFKDVGTPVKFETKNKTLVTVKQTDIIDASDGSINHNLVISKQSMSGTKHLFLPFDSLEGLIDALEEFQESISE